MANKFDGIKKGKTLLSSDGRKLDTISPTGFTG